MNKKRLFKAIYSMIVWITILAANGSAIAQTQTQMTPLEKKLYEAALKEGRLEWGDSLNLKEATAFIKEFSKKYPAIKIDYHEANQDVREERYLSEYAAGRKTLDFTSIEMYNVFKEKNLIADLSDIIKDTKYPLELCARDLMGATIDHTLIGTGYNTKLVSSKDVPRSWEDLLDPKWKGGKIALENRFKLFIYNTPNWGQEKTVKYLKALGGQKPIFSRGVSASVTLLGAGEFPIIMGVYLHRIILQKDKGVPVDWVPLSPIVHQLTPNVVMREAPHPNAAKLFLRWWMTPEGQLFNDKIRLQGNPLPGSQTLQSKAIEKMGIEIVSTRKWEMDNIPELEQLYAKAAGYKIK